MQKVTFDISAPSVSREKLLVAAKTCEPLWKNFLLSPPEFFSLPETLDLRSLQKFVTTERKKWAHILILGIGGSSLGAQAVIEGVLGNFYNTRKNYPTLHFLANIDPLEISSTLKNINLKKTLVLVITKSGGTLETLTQFFLVKEKLGANWRKHFVVVTDPREGYLRRFAQREKLPTFDVPRGVGGRYSVLSVVGIFPALLAGVNARELLLGATEVNPEEAFQFALHHAALYSQGRNVTVFFPYTRNLKKLGEWYAQLLAESVGKAPEIGITPEVSLGASDQHSKLQLWMDGPDDKFFLLFGVEKFARDLKLKSVPQKFAYLKNKTLAQIFTAEREATLQSLAEKSRPLAVFDLPDLSARTLGYLLQFFMLEVSFLGQILGVNPYDQPGVERGKVLAVKRLKIKHN